MAVVSNVKNDMEKHIERISSFGEKIGIKRLRSSNHDNVHLPPRMNTLDLTALFRRLDSDGNGMLMLKEFHSIVSKLKLKRYCPTIEDHIQVRDYKLFFFHAKETF